MRLVIQQNYDLLSEWAANYVAKRINEFAPKEGTPFVLGLPTGSSPLGMYRNLIRLYQEGKVSFRNVVTFNHRPGQTYPPGRENNILSAPQPH